MPDTRRQRTLIILKPDGTNYTRELTGRLIRGLGAGAALLLLILLALVYVVIHQQVRLKRLWNEHQLLVGREIVALSPQPTPAEAVPGAAEPPPGTVVSAGGGDRVQRPAARPAARDQTPAAATPVHAPPIDQAPCRIENFSLLRDPATDGWILEARLTKREWTGDVLRGYVAILIEDSQRPGRYYSIPPLTVADDYPLSPQAGDSFAIRRLKPLHFEFSLPEGFFMREVRMLVYDSRGDLLAEQAFAVEGE